LSEQQTKNAVFDFKLSDPTMLIEAVKTINEVVDKATFSIDNEGLYFRGMDRSHVCLVDLRSGNQDYEKWEVKQAGNFGLRLDEFSKILKSLKKKESLSLSLDEDNLLRIKTPSMSMNLRTIELTSTDCPLPKISYNSLISLTGNELNRILKQISNVSEYVTIETFDHRVLFSGKGDQGDVKIELEKGIPELIEINNREISTSTYSLEYLLGFIKHTNKHTMTLEYSKNMPLRMICKLDHTTDLHFYLAPRVEN
jgi:proliferating cell nuclear antigen